MKIMIEKIIIYQRQFNFYPINPAASPQGCGLIVGESKCSIGNGLEIVFNNILSFALLIFVLFGSVSLMYGQTVSENKKNSEKLGENQPASPVPPVSPISPASTEPVVVVPVLTALEHSWGHFAPQSWVRLQKTTWTNQNGLRIANVRETKTTLQSVEANGVTLQEVITVDMVGKRVENAPVIRRFDFFQQPIQDYIRIRNAPLSKLIVENQVVPCEVRIYELVTTAGKRTVTVWYSTQLYPYVLRIENVLRSLPTEKEPNERILEMAVTEVLETSAFRLRRSKNGTYRLRTTQKSGNVTAVTDSACSWHIPGGVIQQTTREFEEKNNEIREIRTVETRLINYSITIPMGVTVIPDAPLYYSPRWRRYYSSPSHPVYQNVPPVERDNSNSQNPQNPQNSQ
jgi:hypothetical protein